MAEERNHRILQIFGVRRPIIGVVHLLPLPGSPRYGGNIEEIISRALRDAHSLKNGGVHGIIVENLGDAPFYKDRVEPHVVALMSRIAFEIKNSTHLPIGINVLRNDGLSALAVALASGADFIRVNVLVGAVVADQGIIEGNAAELHRYRRNLGLETFIFADVGVKHAVSLGLPLEDEADDAVRRGLADVLIVTGKATGKETDPESLHRVKNTVKDTPVFVGSGLNPENLHNFKDADGFIVGSYFKEDGLPPNPVNVDRVKKFLEAWRDLN